MTISIKSGSSDCSQMQPRVEVASTDTEPIDWAVRWVSFVLRLSLYALSRRMHTARAWAGAHLKAPPNQRLPTQPLHALQESCGTTPARCR